MFKIVSRARPKLDPMQVNINHSLLVKAETYGIVTNMIRHRGDAQSENRKSSLTLRNNRVLHFLKCERDEISSINVVLNL